MSYVIKESNAISLRTAYVLDSNRTAIFALRPVDAEIIVPDNQPLKQMRFDWISKENVYIYRHMRSSSEERELIKGRPCLDQQLRPLKFEYKPEFHVRWSDSGKSVALYLNGEPWAFIYEGTRRGYSKGILPPVFAGMPSVGNQWDQKLFEKIFNAV